MQRQSRTVWARCVQCDLLNPAAAAQFAAFEPQVVVHCAAERRPDKLEGDAAYAAKINADVAGS